MKEVKVIKANTNIIHRGKGRELGVLLRVAAYCRVSTDDEDQLNSYRSQLEHYTDMINKRPDWTFVGVYADEGITGTQTTKREDFQRLINDCMEGKIDMIITKAIARFARNTLDTLKYVRMLKEKNIAVYFEEENINTLTMDGELLLTILSSVAQQEVENISAHVKKGLKMKMQRGELVGFQGCLGYDYDKETKSISVNEQEAEIVRYIFTRYAEGAGAYTISKELRKLGHKTKYGGRSWPESTIRGILRNEKYKGDLLMGKTFTVDPISKRRLENFGEEDKFYLPDHHERIISPELFEQVQIILNRRGMPRRVGSNGVREKFSRKYAFSCVTKCGFCGGSMARRCWHSGTKHSKPMWQCVTSTRGGRKFCPDCKGIEEEQIEVAFVESYKRFCSDYSSVMDDFLVRVENSLAENNVLKEIDKIKREMHLLEEKKKKLLDLRLENLLKADDFDLKYSEISAKIEMHEARLGELHEAEERRSLIKERVVEFRKLLQNNEIIVKFDRTIFESVVENVIIGGVDENGEKDPYQISFVYKMGMTDMANVKKNRGPRKVRVNRETGEQEFVCTSASGEFGALCCDSTPDARRNAGLPCKKIITKNDNNRPNGRLFFCIAKKIPLFPREIRKKASFDH